MKCCFKPSITQINNMTIDEDEKEKRLLEVQKEVNKIEFNLSLKNNR